MKAFILEKNKVQIGDTVFNTTSGHTEHSQANRMGIFQEALVFVEVPGKTLEYAKLAVDLGTQKLYREARHARS